MESTVPEGFRWSVTASGWLQLASEGRMNLAYQSYLRMIERISPGTESAEILNHYRLDSTNQILDELLSWVAQAAKSSSVRSILSGYGCGTEILDEVERRVTIGSYPGGDVNAWVQKVDNDYLVILDVQMTNMLGSFVHLAMATTCVTNDERGTWIGSLDNAALTPEQAQEATRILLSGEDPDIADSFAASDDPIVDFAKEVINQAMLFVIAHEVAHVVLGHLESFGSAQVTEAYSLASAKHDVSAIDRALFSKHQELEADDVAQALVNEIHISSRPPDANSDANWDHHFVGAVAFFGFVEALEYHLFSRIGDDVEEQHRANQIRALSTHSVPRYRRAICIVQNHTDSDPMGLPFCTTLSQIFDWTCGRERFRRDKESVSEIRLLAKSASPRLKEAWHSSRGSRHGFGLVDSSATDELLIADPKNAIDLLALAASEYFDSLDTYGAIGEVGSSVRLGVAVQDFLNVYPDEAALPGPIAEFVPLLVRAIPEMEYVLQDLSREVIRRDG